MRAECRIAVCPMPEPSDFVSAAVRAGVRRGPRVTPRGGSVVTFWLSRESGQTAWLVLSQYALLSSCFCPAPLPPPHAKLWRCV